MDITYNVLTHRKMIADLIGYKFAIIDIALTLGAIMKFIYRIFVLLLVTQPIFAMPAQIMLMRHAEKPEVGNELSSKGWQRAHALPSLFLSRAEFRTYGTPAALYAMSPKNADGSVRAIQTLLDLSYQLNMPIIKKFSRDEVKKLVNNIKDDKDLDGKMIVICWEHKVLEDIAKELGFKGLNWPSEQFDRVWLLNFSEKGNAKSFSNVPEKLLSGDSEN